MPEEAPVISTVPPSTGGRTVTIAVLPRAAERERESGPGRSRQLHPPGRGSAGTNGGYVPDGRRAVVAHDRRERSGDRLADRERFCGLHLPPPACIFRRGRRPRASQVFPYRPSLLAAETGGKRAKT